MVTSREIGTLVVVILKAVCVLARMTRLIFRETDVVWQRNLPNKRHIGKQDPFCTVGLNGEKRRTKAIRRGGQHPEWDEEVRFTLFEDPDAEPAPLVNGDGTPPPPPPKSNGKEPPKIKGGRSMALACYADDPREPDLIGETNVDLTEALTKGETDGELLRSDKNSAFQLICLQEWFTLMNKEKYCGEVYLELTFWSNVCDFLVCFYSPFSPTYRSRNRRKNPRQNRRRKSNTAGPDLLSLLESTPHLVTLMYNLLLPVIHPLATCGKTFVETISHRL